MKKARNLALVYTSKVSRTLVGIVVFFWAAGRLLTANKYEIPFNDAKGVFFLITIPPLPIYYLLLIIPVVFQIKYMYHLFLFDRKEALGGIIASTEAATLVAVYYTCVTSLFGAAAGSMFGTVFGFLAGVLLGETAGVFLGTFFGIVAGTVNVFLFTTFFTQLGFMEIVTYTVIAFIISSLISLFSNALGSLAVSVRESMLK